MSKGRLIVVSGPSGTGKGTVCKRLLEREPTLKLSISCTTRPMRFGDEEGVTYFFKSEDEFQAMIERGEFLEYAGMYGKRYGTPLFYVEEQLDKSMDVLLEIETQGAKQVIQRMKNRVTSIFILPPTMAELKKRLFDRGSETPEMARIRFESAYMEIPLAYEYDHVIVNDELERAVEEICNILQAYRSVPERMEDTIEALLKEATI